jgi:hypothetical protein
MENCEARVGVYCRFPDEVKGEPVKKGLETILDQIGYFKGDHARSAPENPSCREWGQVFQIAAF